MVTQPSWFVICDKKLLLVTTEAETNKSSANNCYARHTRKYIIAQNIAKQTLLRQRKHVNTGISFKYSCPI